LPHHPEIVLYHAFPSRSIIALWMLEETGLPFRIERLDLQKEEQRSPGFMKLNTMGKVPVLTCGETVITETAAICAFLADAVPERELAPPPGDPRRGTYYRWLFFGPSCLEPAITDRMMERPPASSTALGYGDYDRVLSTVRGVVQPGPYLLGQQFTAADVVLGSGLRWGMMFGGVPEEPEFRAYVDRLSARPAWQRTEAREKPAA
jgi:glutathione S-transferase